MARWQGPAHKLSRSSCILTLGDLLSSRNGPPAPMRADCFAPVSHQQLLARGKHAWKYAGATIFDLALRPCESSGIGIPPIGMDG